MYTVQLTSAQGLLSKALEAKSRIKIVRTAGCTPVSEKSRVLFKPAVFVFYETLFPEKEPAERWTFQETWMADDSGFVSLADSFQTRLETMKTDGQQVPDFYVHHRSGSI